MGDSVVVMRGARSIVVVLLIAGALVPGTEAQELTGIATNLDLYLGNTAATRPAITAAVNCNTAVAPEKSYGAVLEAPADGKAYLGHSTSVLACAAYFTLDIPYAIQLEGDAQATIVVKCDTPGVYAVPAIAAGRFSLLNNGVQLGTKDGGTGGACTGTATTIAVAIATKDTLLAPGDRLTVRVVFWHSGLADSASPNFHLVTGAAGSKVTFMAISDAPSAEGAVPTAPASAVLENVTGTEAVVEKTFDGSAESFLFNWLTNLTEAWVNVTVEGTGAVNVTVADGAASRLVDIRMFNNETQRLNLTAAQAGNWTIRLDGDNFTGTVRLRISALPTTNAGDGNALAGAGNDGATVSSDLGLDDTATDDGKGAPVPAFGLLVAALAAIAIARRRNA